MKAGTITDSTPLTTAESGQTEARHKLLDSLCGSLFKTIPVPMVLLDSTGRIRLVNQAAKTQLEAMPAVAADLGIALRCVHSVENTTGCGASPRCENCSLRELVNHTLRTSQPHYQVEIEITSQHGPQRRTGYMLLSTSLLEWPQGRRIIVCLEDITAQKRAELNLRKALENVQRLTEQLRRENVSLRAQVAEVHDSYEIVGKSDALRITLERAKLAAAADANVLITGETGTGKELIARLSHHESVRKAGPLITLNCAALSSNLIESELFGHVAGAFTGAAADKVGRFELANGGTLFLDEIGEIPSEIQAKLLRVIQQGQFERVGCSTTRTVDVRIIAASNRNLSEAVAVGTFRSDLYYRLAVFPIVAPPLRVCRQDIPLLVWHCITKVQARLGKHIDSVSPETMNMLTHYDWPGNVRELENVIERAVILSPGHVLQVNEVFSVPHQHHAQDIESVERSHIIEVLDDCHWKITGRGNASDRLGLKPSTLRSRMKKLGIARPQNAKR